ncbi:MAG: FkbM family methyltransferase, partial [Pseudomonadota bacterium]
AVLEKGHWNRDEFERAIHILIHAGDFSLGGIFLDVGANIGTQSLYALRNGRFGRIVAYEPEPSNAALFRLNMEENERAVPVTLRECAVGAASGEGTLERHASNFGAHRVRTASHSDHQTDHQTGKHSEEDEATAGDALRVEIVTLDEDLAALEITPEQVSLVWIDVEGSEADVIEGANALVAAGRPLVFELLERDRTRETTAQMLSQLAAHYTHVARLQDGVFGKERMDDAGFDRPHDLPAGDYLVWRRT